MVHARRVRSDPLDAFGLGAFSLVGAAMGALLGTPSMLKLFSGLTKEKTMTAMEKALMALLKLVLQKVEDQDSEIEKLKKRPTQESLDAVHREADRLRDEIERLRKERVAIVPHASPRRGKKS